MSWSDFMVKLRGYVTILQDPSAGFYAKIKAGLALIGLIEAVLPDTLPFGLMASPSVMEHDGTVEGCLKALDEYVASTSEKHGVRGMDDLGVRKIGDGEILKLLLPLIQQLLPYILDLFKKSEKSAKKEAHNDGGSKSGG